MTPYVIDKQKQLTIYLLFILGIIFSFGLGFVSGYQIRNTESMIWPPPVEQSSSENEAATDEQVDGIKAEDESKKPEEKKPVEEKKSANGVSGKQAEEARKVSQNKVQEKPITKQSSTKPIEPVQKNSIVSQPAPVKTPPVAVVKPIQPSVKQIAQVVPPKTVISQVNPSDVAAVTIESEVDKAELASDSVDVNVTSAANAKRYYSVQAGLFASRDNAVKFLDELMGNGFDAYLIDFVSSGGDVKYNVRFGRSEDRNTTKQRLDEFRQAFTTPAYIVIGN